MANNTGKRKQTRRTGNSGRRNSRKQDDAVRNNIIVFAFVAVFMLLFIGNLGFGGVAGDTVSGFFFGIFGLINYILPIYLSGICIFCLIRKNEKDTRMRVVFFVLLIFMLCLFFSLIRDGKETIGPALSYTLGKDTRQGGGFVGGALAEFLCSVFGLAGAYVIDILLIILCIIMMTGFSMTNYIKNFFAERKEEHDRNKKLADEDRRIRREERLKEKEALRQEKYKNQRERDFQDREKRKEEAKRREEELAEGISPLQINSKAPRKKSHANSNIHIGRPERELDEPASAPEINPDLPRRERTVSGMTFDTEIAPIDMPELVRSDEMNEIKADSFKAYAEDNERYKHSDAYESGTDKKSDPETDYGFDEVSVNEVVVPSNRTTVSTVDFSESVTREADSVNKDFVKTEAVNAASSRSSSVMDSGTAKNESLHDCFASEIPVQESSIRKSSVQNSVIQKSPVQETPAQEGPAPEENRPYVYPDISLLNENSNKKDDSSENTLQKTADKLELILKNFGVNVRVTGFSHGPSVTRYELLPEMGVKVNKIVNLTDDIKMNLAATDIRIEAPIPGKSAIGIEVPNKVREMVGMKELISSKEFKTARSKIAFCLGQDIAGKIIISDIAKMPHLLIAGATGSGKSVCINSLIISILYHASPEEVKFIMIDPKVVELSVYNGIPHLLIPVVTDPKKASGALQWAVNEMMDRYKKFADTHVRDMEGYNAKIKDGRLKINNNGEEIEIAAKKMPQLVIIVDELADLMMVASKEVEESICRLAQLARAAGIHLVIATQRPSVNVITGLIKANMPSRIALSVTSGVDSRTIIDTVGAERLLGHGDMLYYPQDISKPVRLQGAYVADEEVGRVASFIREHNKISNEDADENRRIQEDVEKSSVASSEDGYTSIGGEEGGFGKDRDELFADAARLLIDKDKGSIGMLQRNFRIGFNRAARIIDQLEEFGVVGPEEGTKPRKILVTLQEFEQMLEEEGGSN